MYKNNHPKYSIWMKEPEDYEFPAAQDYLEILFKPDKAKVMVEKLKKAPNHHKKNQMIFKSQ